MGDPRADTELALDYFDKTKRGDTCRFSSRCSGSALNPQQGQQIKLEGGVWKTSHGTVFAISS